MRLCERNEMWGLLVDTVEPKLSGCHWPLALVMLRTRVIESHSHRLFKSTECSSRLTRPVHASVLSTHSRSETEWAGLGACKAFICPSVHLQRQNTDALTSLCRKRGDFPHAQPSPVIFT